MSNKLALLIGINYTGTNHELNGCINDVQKMKQVLLDHFGYQENQIIVMSDEESGALRPTALNIMNQLGSLIIRAYYNEAQEIWIHYSGHGSYIEDHSGDELDNRDEVIVPLDHDKSGLITDDLLHNYMEYLPSTCECFCLFDCCHSGTILDLEYRYKGDSEHVTENHDSQIRGKVIMFSGCQDLQTSADANIEDRWAGAMTSAFLNALEKTNYEITFYHLLDLMRKYLKDGNYEQIPQLSSSHQLKNVHIFCSKESHNPTFITK